MMRWECSHDEQARTLWREGETATDIALTMGLGLTRSAVLGRLHRLGLMRHDRAATGRAAASVVKIEATRAEKAERQKARRKVVATEASLVQRLRHVSIPPAEQQARTELAVARGQAEPVFTPTQFMERESPAVHMGLKLLDLERNQCRWPRGGDGEPITFCGQTKEAGSSYCPACARLSRQPRGTPEQLAHLRQMTAMRKRTYGALSLERLIQDDVA